jgi:hypothetical protein
MVYAGGEKAGSFKASFSVLGDISQKVNLFFVEFIE